MRAICRLLIAGGVLMLGPRFAHAQDCLEASKEVRHGVNLANGSKEEQAAYLKAINLCPKLAEAHYNLGVNLLKQRDYDGAEKGFRQALNLKEDPAYYLGLANTLLLKGQLDEAKSLYEKVLTLAPDDVRAQQGLSVIYEKKGDLSAAEDVLRQAIQFNNKDPQLFYNLGVILERAGRLDDAATSFETATRNRSDYVDAYLALGRVSRKLGKTDAAERALKTATVVDPKNSSAWLALGSFYERENESLTAAKDALEKALSLEPDNGQAQASLALVTFKLGDKARAVDMLEKLVAKDPKNAEAQSELGWILLQQNRLEEAERALRTAIEIDESDAFARNNLGVLLEKQGKRQAAAEEFAKAKQLAPALKEAADNAARLEKK